MPVVHVTAPPLSSEADYGKLLSELTLALANASGMPMKSIRCTFSPTVAQSRGTADDDILLGREAHSAFIDVLQGPERAIEGPALERVAQTAATLLGLPIDQVWVRFNPLPENTVFRGGKLF